jgi:hypothetical protein
MKKAFSISRAVCSTSWRIRCWLRRSSGDCRPTHPPPQQLAQRVEHRRRGAGQADERGAKVIALVHRDRGLAGQHRRHAAGALLALRPAGAQVQPGLAAVVADGRLDPVIDGAALGVGEQHAVVGAAHPLVQACHGIAGDAQEQLGAFAAFVEQALGKDARALLGPRVEAVQLHGAAP